MHTAVTVKPIKQNAEISNKTFNTDVAYREII